MHAPRCGTLRSGRLTNQQGGTWTRKDAGVRMRFVVVVALVVGTGSPLLAEECPADYNGPKGAGLRVSGSDAKYLQGADPFVLGDASGPAYAYTTNRPGVNVPVYRQEGNGEWTALGDALPKLPPWAERGHTWAPEVMRLGEGKYALWYTVHHRASDKQCIGRALGARPEGPYTDSSSAPFLCDSHRETSIDPSPFRDDDGKLYLLWKTRESAAVGLKTTLWIAPLDAQGNLVHSGGTPLLTNTESWEGKHVEAPTLLRKDGRYYLFYSAGASTPRGYLTSWAVAEHPDGPYRKSGEVLLGGSACMKGAGHQSVISDPKGGYRIYYHALHPDRRESRGKHARFLDSAHLCFSGGALTVQDADCRR